MIYSSSIRAMDNTLQKIEWHTEELEAWKPPEKLTVSEWADNHRILNAKSSAFPGKWKTSRTPYLKKIMDEFNNPESQIIVFCKPTQIGGTEALFNSMGYIIEQDPSPTLVVYPSKELAKSISKNRIIPMIGDCPTLVDRYDEKASELLELQFQNMYLALVGSNSPGPLSSRPIKRIFLDEVDKFPLTTGKEPDPISLATERTKTFYDRKIMMCSTPTLEIGQIWQSLLSSDVIYQYFIPCPYCGEFHTLKFKQIKWPEDINNLKIDERVKMVRDHAYYACEDCGQIIRNNQKQKMLIEGQWWPVKYEDENWICIEVPKTRCRKVGYHLNSIYSPWVTFGDVAAEFLESKDNPEKLMNFINSWLGEPWRDKGNKMKSDIVMEKQSSHEQGEVPRDTVFLTAGVDVQKDHFWYTIRAWGEGITSWLVDYGRAETWNEIEEVLIDRRYKNAIGQEFVVRLAFIDSGYRTDEVYQFCSMFPEACVPSKGSNTRLKAPVNVSTIEKNGFYNLKLYNVDTHYFKDFIAGRLGRDVEAPGSWMIFKDCPREFADQVTAEQKITRQERGKSGKITDEWIKISSHAQNHLLDCSVYDAAAAEICGVRYIQKPTVKKVNNEAKKKDWIPNKNWFSRR